MVRQTKACKLFALLGIDLALNVLKNFKRKKNYENKYYINNCDCVEKLCYIN